MASRDASQLLDSIYTCRSSCDGYGDFVIDVSRPSPTFLGYSSMCLYFPSNDSMGDSVDKLQTESEIMKSIINSVCIYILDYPKKGSDYFENNRSGFTDSCK